MWQVLYIVPEFALIGKNIFYLPQTAPTTVDTVLGNKNCHFYHQFIACGLSQRKEREHMGKQKYQMDFSFLEDYDNSTTHYQPFDLLATPGCIPMMVMCSKKPEPAAWSIIGVMYSVHFLHYKDMEDYITSHGLTRWTDEHDRKSGLCLCGISNRCRIF